MSQENIESCFRSVPSPSTHLRESTQSENDSSPSRVPRPQSITSASRIVPKPAQYAPSHVASLQYVKQYQAFMERQRQVHEEERALWHTERKELHDRITELENSLHRYQAVGASPTQVLSPASRSGVKDHGSFWNLLSTDGSRESSTSTGDEVWRGSKPDVQPIRTFSNTSHQSVKPESRLPSIAEDAPNTGRRNFSRDFQGPRPLRHKPSINGVLIDTNLDGINFKPSILPPDIIENVMTPLSISPSPANASPGTTAKYLLDLKASDPYTKDAGHTPLARHNYSNNDGASDASTPEQAQQEPEIERRPLGPRTTMVKAPSERSDSYFPPPMDGIEEEDPELKGPLTLTNNESQDDHFLTELNTKLQVAARSEPSESPSAAGASDSIPNAEGEKEFEQPEHEPTLRMKSSMNFGSAFGSKHCGKGF